MNELVPVATGGEVYRQSTDAAGLCREIVTKTASNIQGRKYVSVEGWQAIAIAHGCAAAARDVERVDGGVRAIGEVRRMSDGQVISTAEGFVGEDEPTWFGGEQHTRYGTKTLPKRADYAIRAMAQTRAISRACRSAFAHVVVMIDAGLSTTPAEEMIDADFTEATPKKRGLDGPYTSKTALHQALVKYQNEVGACASHAELDMLEKDKGYTAFVEQCERDAPHYLRGGDPAPPEFVGLFDLLKRARDHFDLEAANESEAEEKETTDA